jgi:hypothetical protein
MGQSYRAARGIPTRRHEGDEEDEEFGMAFPSKFMSLICFMSVGIPLKITNDFDGTLEDSR